MKFIKAHVVGLAFRSASNQSKMRALEGNMRAVRWIQALFAILSIPCLLGWIIITLASVTHLPETIETLAAAESVFKLLKGLATTLLASIVIVLGWWGWHSLWWAYLFYPPLARRCPKWVTLGNIAGANIVLIQLAFLLTYSRPISLKLIELPEATSHFFPLFLLFGGAPLLLLSTNLLAAHRQRKSLCAHSL